MNEFMSWVTDVFKYVQQWQTLIASLIALAAARRAYAAAMAKVEFDKEVFKRTIINRKLQLFLRLRLALARLKREAAEKSELAPTARIGGDILEPGVRFAPYELRAEDVQIDLPDEINEAWALPELFPQSAFESLSELWWNCKLAKEFLDDLNPEQVWKITRQGAEAELRIFILHCGRVRTYAERLYDEIDELTKELQKVRLAVDQ
jgi:hypothetical protein